MTLSQKDPVHQLGGSPGFMTSAQRASGSCGWRIFAQFHVVCQLQPFLNQESLHSIIQAIIISCFDYWNLLYTLQIFSVKEFYLAESGEQLSLLWPWAFGTFCPLRSDCLPPFWLLVRAWRPDFASWLRMPMREYYTADSWLTKSSFPTPLSIYSGPFLPIFSYNLYFTAILMWLYTSIYGIYL